MKRRVASVFMAGALVSAMFFPLLPVRASAAGLSRNLKIGDYGEDVMLLQKMLNNDIQPGIATAGPGSPGNETMFFGERTRAAVVRFQEKYALDILYPAGLAQGTGFVGVLTRTKLSSLAAGNAPTASTAGPGKNAPAANPNLVNLDTFIEGMAEIQRERGVAEPEIERIKKAIRTEAMTRGDFKEEFARRDAEAAKAKLQSNSTWRDILIASFKKVDPFIKIANAQGPAFGGPITYVWPCSCPPTTAVIYIGPPSTVQALDYTYGTQAFLSFNLPYARFALGLYVPGAGETCWNYAGTSCWLLASEGMVSSVVGSSP